jgi:predicted component of type VI protein secretion system
MATQAYQLVMRTGPQPGKVFPVNQDELTIGRDVNNDIVISDVEVSREHARLVLQSGSYVLEDLGSTNGTFVAGQRLMGPHVLLPGETIMFGENVSLSFDLAYDENATMVSAQAAPPPPRPAVSQPERPAQRPVYAGQVPHGPAAPYNLEPPVEDKKSNRGCWIAGCAVLLVLLCIAVAGGFVFDYLNLYCTSPFDVLFYCP